MRDRFIGLDMDKAKDELVKAYKYEADTHGQVVRDGLTLRIEVRGSHADFVPANERALPLADRYLTGQDVIPVSPAGDWICGGRDGLCLHCQWYVYAPPVHAQMLNLR